MFEEEIKDAPQEVVERPSILWCEEYRPRKIEDCVLPDRLKSYFQAMVTRRDLQNMTLVGSPGTGKTTVAKALCDELGIDWMLINASENGNIDTIRTDVKRFASSVSMFGGIKCIILDEADGTTRQAQESLRGIIEEMAGNCRFIFTGNFSNRITDALKSRAPVVEYSFTREEKKQLIIQFDKRIRTILAEKNIIYDRAELATLVMKNFPDFRKTLNLLQRFSATGELKVSGATGLDDEQFKLLITYLRERKWTEMRRWVVDNLDNDGAMIRRMLYERATECLEFHSIPQLVLFISLYDDRESRVVDKEINTVAFLTECMSDLKWKTP